MMAECWERGVEAFNNRHQSRSPHRRTGMYTTALIVLVGEQRICLYYTGRRHAGENLEALLTLGGTLNPARARTE
jgi:hypothetical protein